MPDITVYITSGTTWTVPVDFSANNTIETIGGGAGTGGGGSTGGRSGGAGGGAYAKIVNFSAAPGFVVGLAVGAGGAGGINNNAGGTGGDTYFNGGSVAASSVGAKGGTGSAGINNGGNGTGGAGGNGFIILYEMFAI